MLNSVWAVPGSQSFRENTRLRSRQREDCELGAGVSTTSARRAMKVHRWSEIEREELSPGVARQMLHSDRMTVARIYLKKGAIVPRHHHENEQVSFVLEGRLRFEFDSEQVVVAAGEAMQIDSGRPHRVEALEDSLALDLFQPVREDWLRGEDAYLRNPSGRS